MIHAFPQCRSQCSHIVKQADSQIKHSFRWVASQKRWLLLSKTASLRLLTEVTGDSSLSKPIIDPACVAEVHCSQQQSHTHGYQ